MSRKLISNLPKDPFGENYLYDKTTMQINSNKGGNGLSFKGKTKNNSELK